MENGQDISAEIGFQEEIYRRFGESKLKPEQYSALGLAYIGDAVYDLIIRTLVLRRGNYSVKTFHKMTSSIVKAEAQARLVESIEPDLTEEENRGKLALFGGIKNARFRKQVTPGDVLTLHCELVEQRGPVGVGKASAYVDGKCAATAELTFVLTDAQ